MKKKWSVSAEVTISLHATVKAETKEEAIALAGQLDMMSLCHQCAGDHPPREPEWRTSGELDGEPINIDAEADS